MGKCQMNLKENGKRCSETWSEARGGLHYSLWRHREQPSRHTLAFAF